MTNDAAAQSQPTADPASRGSGSRELSPKSKRVVDVEGLHKQFERGNPVLEVLNNANLQVDEGSFVAFMGPSGSGKSTLLNIMAELDAPTRGSVRVGGVDLPSLSEDARAKWRATNVGFVFQGFNLMPVLSALENVALPLLLTKLPAKERIARARVALDAVGLSDRQDHFPRELSGGQEQRVAVARAIVSDPALIVADEPTGDLDMQSADEVLALMETPCRDLGKTILMGTHAPEAGERASVLHRLNKGTFA